MKPGTEHDRRACLAYSGTRRFGMCVRACRVWCSSRLGVCGRQAIQIRSHVRIRIPEKHNFLSCPIFQRWHGSSKRLARSLARAVIIRIEDITVPSPTAQTVPSLNYYTLCRVFLQGYKPTRHQANELPLQPYCLVRREPKRSFFPNFTCILQAASG